MKEETNTKLKVIDTKHIADELKLRLANQMFTIHPEPVGTVVTSADGVVGARGLSQVGYQELVEFESGILGVTLSLEETSVGIVVLGDYLKVREGERVKATGRLLSIPVGEALIGRVVDPLGVPKDGKEPPQLSTYYPLEKIAPGVTVRKSVDTPLQTGIKAVDSMIPIGRGQRELIIGDRGTGKTALVLDTIINQKKEGVVCIYVAIGQKASRVAQVIDQLNKYGAMEYTIVVAANASDPVALQYIAPYAGCAIGEYFMDKGRDALVVYDDLSKHAWAYRQISLILKRPSGREAYPGDVFYLHSRLLERACRLDGKHGGGSLTALPIIETQAGDVSAYIPTNVISITDGQIYLESDLFYAGVRPAVNVGLSVSRVGSAAQIKAMKQVAGKLRLELAQYRELAAFVQFATDLDQATKDRISRGSRLVEVLKQHQYVPMPVANQVLSIWTVTNGFTDDIPIENISRFEEEFVEYVENTKPKLLAQIKKEGKLTDELTKELQEVAQGFKKRFVGGSRGRK